MPMDSISMCSNTVYMYDVDAVQDIDKGEVFGMLTILF